MRTFLPATLALLVAGCERVTAPKALEIVDTLERKLEAGGLMSIQSFLEHTNNPGVSLFDFHGRSLLGVMRDGSMEQLNALVVERVYLPADSVGAPKVRRTLFAWPDSADFAIVAMSELHPGDVGTSQYFDPNERLSPPAVLTVHFQKKEDIWIPRSGVVDIRAGASEGSCPLRVTQYDYRPDPISCELVSFPVEVRGELVRERDTQTALIAALVPRHQIVVTSQRVHGVRFTVDCSKAKPPFKGGSLSCVSDLSFWRDNSLFARSLGVDVRKIKNKPGSDLHFRQIRPGHGSNPTGDWMIRWTASAPDGRTLLRDSVGPSRALPLPLPWYDFLLWETGAGGKRQYLLPAADMFPSAKPSEIVVLDVEWVTR